MPYQNEHSCRLLDPNTSHIRVRRSKNGTVQGVKLPDTISTIWYIKKDDDGEHPQAQALRFPVKHWSESEARAWLKKNKIKFISFEPASKEEDLCYTAVAKSDTELSISLHDEIGFTEESTSKAFYDLLTPNLKTINIDINSPGGSVRDGLSIYEQLKSHPATVNVKISGVAASMASVIAMAGNTITMPETSILMIHKPLIPVLVAANSDKLRKSAEALDTMEKAIIKAYQTRMTNKSESQIAAMLSDETWLNADRALELGLADSVTTEATDIMNFHDFSKYDYKNMPVEAVNLYSIDANDEIAIPEEDILKPSILAKIKKFIFDEIDKPLTKESSMEQAAIDKLNADFTASTTENISLKAEIVTLNEKVTAFAAEKEAKATEIRKADSKTYLDSIVAEGRIRPVDLDNHMETMELKFKSEDGETKVNEYKAWLKSLPVVVDLSGKHVADKNVASTKSDDPLELLTQKIMAENKTDYVSALRVAYSQHPEYLKTE